MTIDKYTQRRNEVLAKARAIAEKAQAENRELTKDEADAVSTALTEARQINQDLAADAASKHILGQLDDMARGTYQQNNAGQRLCFKGMGETAAREILPASPLGQKAVSPSGAVLVPQSLHR